MSNQIDNEVKFEARELPSRTVIVYGDKAEVKRVLSVELKAGITRVIVENVSSVIDRHSIKVDGIGAVSIQDVQYTEHPVNPLEATNNQVLDSQKNNLESQRTTIEDQIYVLKKRLTVLDGVAEQIGHSTALTGKENQQQLNPFLLNEDSMKNLTNFLNFYAQNANDLRKELRESEQQLIDVKNKIGSAEKLLNQQRCKLEYDSHKRNIEIIVRMSQEDKAELHLSYQVFCATWKPTYDIRVTTVDPENNNAPNKVRIMYYGLVEQKTDEAWNDCEVILSTATPCVAGSLPSLPTLTATFQKPSVRPKAVLTRRKPMSAGSEEDMGFGSYDYNECTDAAALQRMTIAYTASDQEYSLNQNFDNIPCSCFPVERPATILSDGLCYKLLIAQLDLNTTFSYETLPSKMACAFLSAEITNTSSIPVLPGTANIYLNNSFIATTHLRSIMPGEEFRCSLGVDPAIKVDYKPCTRSNELIGFVTKNSLCTHEQVISLHNAKPNQNAQITIREPIPKAGDEKIKISVVSPDLRPGRTDARLSKDQHLEWVVTLGPGEQKELRIKYTVEYPVNENVVYCNQVKAY